MQISCSSCTLSTQDHAKLLQQLKSGLKRTINLNKYRSKVSIERRNQYLDYLIHQSFLGVNRPFELLFENDAHQRSCKRYFLQTVKIKDYNVVIVGQNYFDQPVKSNSRAYNNIRKVPIGQGDD